MSKSKSSFRYLFSINIFRFNFRLFFFRLLILLFFFLLRLFLLRLFLLLFLFFRLFNLFLFRFYFNCFSFFLISIGKTILPTESRGLTMPVDFICKTSFIIIVLFIITYCQTFSSTDNNLSIRDKFHKHIVLQTI